MWRRMVEMITLLATSTRVRATAMVAAVAREVVTASAEQIPRICRVTGLLSRIGWDSTRNHFIVYSPSSASRSSTGP